MNKYQSSHRMAGKMFNAINDMVQNPKRIMLVSKKRKKELEKLHPYLAGRFKTKAEINKKVPNKFPSFPKEKIS